MPALDQRFDELFDHVADLRERSKAHLFLTIATSRYGLRHIAYAGKKIPRPNRGPYYVNVTYPDCWMERYFARGYIDLDPVVRRAHTTLAPFDWSDLGPFTRSERDFFGESVEFGLGRQGMTFPVRGAGGQLATFNINSDASDREWRSLKRLLMRDFQVLAVLFHEGVLQAGEACPRAPESGLSNREIECLKWAAGGKSAWETSVILGISERCVRFHLDQARRKLDCKTKVQTVAKAMAVGLVNL